MESEWKIIYNNIFRCFPPSEAIVEKIIVTFGNKKLEFNNIEEMITYLALSGNDSLSDDNISFILRDDNFKSNIDKNIIEILKKIQEKRGL